MLSFLSPFVYFFAIANHVYAMLCHCNTYLRNSFAFHCFSSRCLASAYQFHSSHLLAFAMHRLSTPSLLTSMFRLAVAYQSYALHP
jgi:hypothetical protein